MELWILLAQGREAFLSGEDLEDCPYPEDTDAGAAWYVGYEEAEEVGHPL